MTCQNGHDVSGPNPYYIRKDGSRRCRQCKKLAEKRHDQRHPGRQKKYTARLAAYYTQIICGGQEPSRNATPEWGTATENRLIELWHGGMSAVEIARVIERTPRAIYLRLRILRMRGIPIETRSARAKTLDPIFAPVPEPEPILVAPVAPRGFAVYASGIRDFWNDEQPIGACRPASGR